MPLCPYTNLWLVPQASGHVVLLQLCWAPNASCLFSVPLAQLLKELKTNLFIFPKSLCRYRHVSRLIYKRKSGAESKHFVQGIPPPEMP